MADRLKRCVTRSRPLDRHQQLVGPPGKRVPRNDGHARSGQRPPSGRRPAIWRYRTHGKSGRHAAPIPCPVGRNSGPATSLAGTVNHACARFSCGTQRKAFRGSERGHDRGGAIGHAQRRWAAFSGFAGSGGPFRSRAPTLAVPAKTTTTRFRLTEGISRGRALHRAACERKQTWPTLERNSH